MKVLVRIKGSTDDALRDLVRAHGVTDVATVSRKERSVEAIVDDRLVQELTAAGYDVHVVHDEKAAEARRADIEWHPDDDPRKPREPHRGWPWPRVINLPRFPRRPE